VFAAFAALTLAPLAWSQTISAQAFVTGLNKPIHMVSVPTDPSRLYVAEQRGVIKLIKNGVVQASPFLDQDAAIPDATYTGLFGIAFHPNYAANGRLYLFHTTGTSSAATVWVREFTRAAGDPDHADVATARVILKVSSPAPTAHHLGGTPMFGPDGKLYLPLGDGGTTGDAQGPVRSQSNTSLWGKLLRIDVDVDDFPADPNANYGIPADNPYAGSATVAKEIFARGLRNPFRCSVDRATGKLWLGDVGLTSREEIDLVNTLTDGAANLGWNCAEGLLCTTNANCTCGSGLKAPVYDYPSSVGHCVTGGARYNGCAIPALVGTYIFADYQNNKLFSFQYNDGTGAVSGYMDRTSQVTSPALSTPICIAEDAYGELYVVEHTAGRIRKLVSNPLPTDSDGDGIPDLCEPPAGDLNGDLMVDGADLGILLGGWGSPGAADLNHDGTVDGADLGMLLGDWTT
jgi:glucose/arabinose dehydrogenase